MKATIQKIASLLCRIQQEGGSHNFVIFTSDSAKNYYIQVASEEGSPYLSAETVSNKFLAPQFQLSMERQIRLQALGWNPPERAMANFHREWQAENDEARLVMAQVVMRTFIEIYGMSPDQPLEVELCLE